MGQPIIRRYRFMRFCSAIFFCFLAGLSSVTGQSKTASIDFESQNRDSGKIMEGETIKQVFQFTNKGAGVLEIRSVEPS
jgi:hypothetical protein